MLTIPFNKPSINQSDLLNISKAFENGTIAGNGPFTKKSQLLLKNQLSCSGTVLLTTSCTHALEIAAILLDLKPGDEIIVPSFTFVSTALAFYMHGAKIVFIDIRSDTLNLDESRIEELITERTRAIVPVHYGGIGCDMDLIMALAYKYDIVVIEDNAHGLYGKYKNQLLGTIGHMATQSFHETKNIICGEGGALIINDQKYAERAEIIRDKGTNRSQFFRGELDKYTWVEKGSSYLMSDMLAAFLYGQLVRSDLIQQTRSHIWTYYNDQLFDWAAINKVRLPYIPEYCEQSFHMYYMLMPNGRLRNKIIDYLNSKGIKAVFHYMPLHSSEMGVKLGLNDNHLPITCEVSKRLVRLPFFEDIGTGDLKYICETVKSFDINNI